MTIERTLLREYGLPLLLCALSAITITANGARFLFNYLAGQPPVTQDSDLWPWPWLAAHPRLFVTGWSFSCALLGILLLHEFGHLLACRKHGIRASLPWVWPAPTLCGTFGAVIRLRSAIPHRSALMDLGFCGPLAGYAASCVAIAVGMTLGRHATPLGANATMIFGGQPLTFHLMHALLACFNPAIPAFGQTAPHPVLLAGWIGMLVTSLNLLPGGQLDGGHILYALSPRVHRTATRLLPVLLIAAGLFYWVGWIIWGLLLLLPALRHPRVCTELALPRSRTLMGLAGLLLLCLTFSLTPFAGSSLLQLLR